MARTIRSRNLDLIRWMNFGQKHTASKLAPITNPSYVSQMATGDRPIDDTMARDIEQALELPVQWMDRNNLEVITMSDIDHQLHVVISAMSPATKSNLYEFLRSVQAGNSQILSK